MGLFSKWLNKDTDLIGTIWDLDPWMKAIGFKSQMDEIIQGNTLFNRLTVQRGALALTVVWDGEVATFLQKHELNEPINLQKYQQFHSKKRYFTLTYGGPGHTLMVKHSIFMSKDTPIVAASVQRVMETWDKLDISGLTDPSTT